MSPDDRSNRLELVELYAPIVGGLARVEAEFRSLTENKKAGFPALYQMLCHVLVGGKVLRPVLTLLSAGCFNGETDRIVPLATASELLHIATLVHDDAIDKADTRRGKPTVSKLWGLEKAILLGDFLFARAGEFAAATGNLHVVRLFARTLQIISSGELRQSFAAFSPEQSYEHYLERIAGKTAALFVLATEGGAVLAGATDDGVKALHDYGYNLGLAFQIVDDILDFTGDEKEMGKPVGSDLRQGTITLPALLLMQRSPGDNPVDRLIRGEDREANIARTVSLVRGGDIIEQCYAVARGYRDRACGVLDSLPDSPARRSLMELADYVIRRDR